MQQTGYIQIGDEKILVLMRDKKHTRLFKRRRSGRDGKHMIDEQLFLEERPDLVAVLKLGARIEL